MVIIQILQDQFFVQSCMVCKICLPWGTPYGVAHADNHVFMNE